VLAGNELYNDYLIFCCVQAERLDPKNPRWPYFRGGALLNLSRREEALAPLRRAAELAERNLDGHPVPTLWLAETLLACGQDGEAEKHFRAALDSDENNPRAHFGLAQIAGARGDWKASRAHLEAAWASPQGKKKTGVQLAAVCERLGDSKAAAEYAALTARLPNTAPWFDPFLLEAAEQARRKRDRNRAAENLEAAGQLDAAARILADTVARYPDDYLPRLVLGRVLTQLGRFDAAEEHLLRARALAPDKTQSHYLLALLWYTRGEALTQGKAGGAGELFEKAVAAARKALEIQPDFGVAHMVAGLSLKRLGRKAEAVEALRLAAHCNPEHAEHHLNYGTILAEEGRKGEARPFLERALALAPNDPRAAAALERFLPRKDK
jgi:tetratricopeptide (TPR) repeat protein